MYFMYLLVYCKVRVAFAVKSLSLRIPQQDGLGDGQLMLAPSRHFSFILLYLNSL